MIICFDIGNTNTVIGVFDGKNLVAEFRLKSDQNRTSDEYAAYLIALLKQKLPAGARITSSIISSVVPPLTPLLSKVAKESLGLDSLIVGPGTKTGLAVKLGEPGSVGADRIVNAVAARELYGVPALIVDFGTATSFDYVNQDGAYEGGAIAPGVGIAMDALVRNTAKLPRVEIKWPDTVIGKNTTAAMQSGTVVGYLALVDGLIARMEAEAGKFKHILATGGLGNLFAKHSTKIMAYDPQLTLKGLQIIAALNS